LNIQGNKKGNGLVEESIEGSKIGIYEKDGTKVCHQLSNRKAGAGKLSRERAQEQEPRGAGCHDL
jgi:hypothetical protein